MKSPLLVLVALALIGATSCVPATARSSDDGVELTVAAAASLATPLEQIRTAYRAAVPEVRVVPWTDSSAALRTQIEQGAHADVFLSADQANVDALVRARRTRGGAVAFAANHLSVIVPRDNPAGIRSPTDLARPGVRIVAAGAAVPVTAYADQLVTRLADLPGYGAQFPAAYARNVASREANVSGVVTRIELGEGDAAIVYATDARAAGDRVKEIPVPPAAQVTPVHVAVVLGDTAHPDEAAAFIRWLTGPDGQAILRDAGYLPVS